MRKLVYYIGATLDGYIAGPGGEIDFFPLSEEMLAWIGSSFPETIPTHLREHVGLGSATNRAFDTVVMGRATYEPALSVPTTSPYSHLRQYVVSTTLTIDDPSVTVVADDPVALVRGLKKEPGMDIWLCGGGTLAGALVDEIDEIVLKTYPVVAGAGIPLLSGAFSPTAFTPARRHSISDGTQITWLARQVSGA
ncbi:dihydrofolate reductase family protein [Salana multivorans]